MSLYFNGTPISDSCNSVRFNGSEITKLRFNGVEVWNCITYTCPKPPLISCSSDSNSINLDWEIVDGAASYNVYNAVGDVLLGNTTASEYTYTGGIPGSTYIFYVTSIPYDTDNCDESGPSNDCSKMFPIPEPDCPDAPTGLTATATATSIFLNWSTMPYTESYVLYNASTGSIIQDSITDSEYNYTQGIPGTTYSFYVKGNPTDDSCSISDPSNIATEKYPETVVPDCPDAPTGLSVVAQTLDVKVTWNSTAYAASYDVYVDGSFYRNTTETSLTYSEGTPGNIYEFCVKAKPIDTINCSVSDCSNSDNVTYPTPPPDCPDVPTNFTASNSGLSITCSWDSMPNASEYKVYDGSLLLATTSSTSYSFTGEYNTVYVLSVSAVPSDPACGGETGKSPTDIVTTPPEPVEIPDPCTNITASDCSQGSIQIAWIGPGPDFKLRRDGYTIYSGSNTLFVDTGVSAGNSYTYSVTCYNSAGESDAITDTGSVGPGAVTAVELTEVGDEVMCTWSSAIGAGSYFLNVPGVVITCTTGTSWNLGTLDPGTYTATVTPNSGSDCSSCEGSSASDNITIEEPPPPPVPEGNVWITYNSKGGDNPDTVTGSNGVWTFTVPDNITRVVFQGIAAGGSGASQTRDNFYDCGGGYAGQESCTTASVVGGTEYTLIVGQGGASVTSSTEVAGQAGGNTSAFGNSLTGGAGGTPTYVNSSNEVVVQSTGYFGEGASSQTCYGATVYDGQHSDPPHTGSECYGGEAGWEDGGTGEATGSPLQPIYAEAGGTGAGGGACASNEGSDAGDCWSGAGGDGYIYLEWGPSIEP